MQSKETFKLPEAFTIEQMSLYKSELLSLVELDGDLSVDTSELQRIDAAGLQWLLVLKRALKQHERVLRWPDLDDKLATMMRSGGFGAVLEGE